MPRKFIKIKEVELKNNCPVCYSNEHLRITFSQGLKENRFYKWLTGEVKNDMSCMNCNSTIYPVQWTDDIERVYDYHMKAFQAQKPVFHLKKLAWITITFVAIVITGIAFTVFYTKL